MRAAPALLVLLACARAAWGSGTTELESPPDVQGLLREDVDGDGAAEVLVVEGREVWVWAGRTAGPGARPDRRVRVPDDVSFVDVEPGRSGLWLLGGRGLRFVPFEATRPAPEPSDGARTGEASLAWVAPGRVAFADLRRAGVALEPAPNGWSATWGASGGAPRLVEVDLSREVKPPGAFLEDSGTVIEALPDLFVGRSRRPDPSGTPALWALSGAQLVGFDPTRVAYDASFLPATGTSQRRLLDLDADGVPDLAHLDATNNEFRIAFFRTPPPVEKDAVLLPGGSLRPALAYLRLSGFPMDPTLADLDADGRPDFVLTSIDIDPKNVLRAVSSGQVTAQTRAFLNRRARDGDPLFPPEPDAEVTSDVGVAIRFNYAGHIQIKRSFTIVVDGDYDGDRRKDLLIRTAPGEFTLRRGVAAGVWEADGVPIEVPSMEEAPDVEAYPADLTGDGRDEVLLVYRKPPGGRDRIVVLRP